MNFRFSVISILFLWFLLISALPCRASEAENQYALAAGHYSRERWKLAAEEFQQFLADYPAHPRSNQARFFLAESYLQLRDYQKASDLFRQVLRSAPEPLHAQKALFRAGEAGYLAGSVQQAREDLETFLQKYPDDSLSAYALTYLGNLARKDSDPFQARRRYQQALDKFPESPLANECRYGLARLAENEGRFPEAMNLLIQVAKTPSCPLADDSMYRLAILQQRSGNSAVASKQLLDLEEKYPSSSLFDRSQLLRAKILLLQGESQKSIELLDRLIQRPEITLESRLWSALAHKTLGHWEIALRQLNAEPLPTADDPLAPSFALQKAEVLLLSGRVDEAQKGFEDLYQNESKEKIAADAQLGKIKCALIRQDYPAVERMAADFTVNYPEHPLIPEAKRLLARSHLERGQYAAAVRQLDGLIQNSTKPSTESPEKIKSRSEVSSEGSALPQPEQLSHKDSQSENHYLLALAYQGQARHVEVLSVLEPLLKSSTADPLVNLAWKPRALAYSSLEKFPEALSAWDEYLKGEHSARDRSTALGQRLFCLAKSGQWDKAQEDFSAFQRSTQGEAFFTTTAQLAELAKSSDNLAWSNELFTLLTGPDTPESQVARGLTGLAWNHYHQKNLAEAEKYCDRLVTDFSTNPLVPEGLLLKGLLLDQRGETDAALQSYEQLLEKFPQSGRRPEAMLFAARLEDQLQHPEKSWALYERWLKEFPSQDLRDAALYEGAWVLRSLKREEESLGLLQEIHKNYSTSSYWPDVVYRLAENSVRKKDYPQATQLLQELLDQSPEKNLLAHALFLQAQIAVAQQQWPDTLAPLERLLNETPDSSLAPLAEYWKAEATYRQNDHQRALVMFEAIEPKLQQPHPDLVPLLRLRKAQILAHQKEWEEARTLAEQIRVSTPEFDQLFEVDYLIGRCWAGEGNFDQARDSYLKVVRSGIGGKTETAAMAQWMIGESYFHQKKYLQAIREYLKVEILYNSPQWQAGALLQAGKCHEMLGEWEEATQLYTRLLKIYPGTTFQSEASRRLETAQQRTPATLLQ